MASRRTRIKGIANIPQRKKVNQDTNQDIAKSNNTLLENECDTKVLKTEDNHNEFTAHKIVDLGTNSFESVKELPTMTHDNNVERATEEYKNNDTNFNTVLECLKPEVMQSLNTSNLKVTEFNDNIKNEFSGTDIVKKTATQISGIKDIDFQNSKTNISRRKFLKPGINLNAIKKRQTIIETTESLPAIENAALSEAVIKQEKSNKIEEQEITLKPVEKVVVISEIRISKNEYKPGPIARDVTKIISRESNNGSLGPTYSEITLNETHLGVNEVPVLSSSVVTFTPSIKNAVPETHNVSDSEYPAPPPSPSKINRSRIKAIPRLSQRKTSCSASESEDETRRYGRIRNNSVCSVVSTTCLEPPTPTSENVPSKDITPILQKKINRTEQSRKLAEARREFQKRFGANSPDKQRLKMIDLIFYNPSTNPMSQTNGKPLPENGITKLEKESEEIVDDPSKVTVVEEKENDADNFMPVPQIKIGPSGEIILDEQSLIVENSVVARQKEQIHNSQLVDGDFDTGYGIYKRAPRAMPWSPKETLRFYKALNLIGTDFTVMTQLFPKRTRRELKIKFKKEERANRHLIDRAIMQPCNYNFTDLKREIEIEEEEEVALQKLKEEERKKLEESKQLRREKKIKDKDANASKRSPEPIDTTSDPNKDTISLPPKKRLKGLQKPIKIMPKPRKIKTKPLNIKSVIDDDSDADISDIETQSESEEEETIPFLKPTRSGRMPKSTMRFTTIVNEVPRQSFDRIKMAVKNEISSQQSSGSTKTFTTPDEVLPKQPYNTIRNRRSSSISSIESNSEKLVPGAVVVMTGEDSNGKSEYKVFMVTPERKMAPLDLDSDIVARLVKERQDEDNAEFMVPTVPEKNVTIPATNGENVSESEKPQEILFINGLDVTTAMIE